MKAVKRDKYKYLLYFLLTYMLIISCDLPVWAGKTNLNELNKSEINNLGTKDLIDKDHWVYNSLKKLVQKYNYPSDKLNEDQPLTRDEAAIILINLTGKIEENKLELSEAEQVRIEILKSELNGDIRKLSKRLDALEASIQALSGSVTKLQKADNSSVKYGFAESVKIKGAIATQYTGNFGKGLDSRPSNFSIPAVDITLTGKIRPHLDYFISTYPSRTFDSSANGLLGDVWLSTDIVPYNTLYLGQKRKPIGLEGVQSAYTLETVERAQIARKFGDKRDTGLTTIGNWKFLDYMAGVYNGSGINSKDTENSDLEYAFLATVNPLYKIPEKGSLKVGGVIDHGKETYTHKLYGLVGQYKSPDEKFKFQGEYLQKDGYLAANQKASGWYLHSSYFLTDKFQLLARFDRFDQNVSGAQDILTEYTLGSNYYFFDHNLKLMTNLVYVHNKFGADSKRVLVKTQYRF